MGSRTSRIPAHIVKQWQFHATFASDFTHWPDEFLEKGGIVQETHKEEKQEQKEDEEDDSKKRKGAPEVPAAAPPKKVRKVVDPSYITETEKITTPWLQEVKCGKAGLLVQVRAQHQVFLVNKSQQAVMLNDDHYIGSFGGSYMVEFVLERSDDWIVTTTMAK